MSLRRHALLLAATMPGPSVLGGCSGPPPAANDGNQIGSMGAPAANMAGPTPPVAETAAARRYLGKWIGPEGLVLEVTPKPGGGVKVVNRWTLDDGGTFDGSITATGLQFTRGGDTVTAIASDGDATGLKWLAGKQACLTVKPGEGYCRD